MTIYMAHTDATIAAIERHVPGANMNSVHLTGHGWYFVPPIEGGYAIGDRMRVYDSHRQDGTRSHRITHFRINDGPLVAWFWND